MKQDIYSDELSVIANPEPLYNIYTLIDITDSGVITPKNNKKGFHQAQNLNTFLQVLGLRTQVLEYKVKKIKTNYAEKGFVNLDGSGNIWNLKFRAEATAPWAKDDDNLFWLIQDFAGTPIHVGLNESIKITPEIVNTIDKLPGEINTRFNICMKS